MTDIAASADEQPIDEPMPHADEGGNGHVAMVTLDGEHGFDEADLARLELAEEARVQPSADELGPADADEAFARLEARTERLAQAYEQREAARVHRKVTAAAAGSTLAGGIPAILAAVDALNLPADLQPFVLVAIAVLGALCAGYATPERTAPGV